MSAKRYTAINRKEYDNEKTSFDELCAIACVYCFAETTSTSNYLEYKDTFNLEYAAKPTVLSANMFMNVTVWTLWPIPTH